jgi:hypothetical protein
MAVFHRVGVVRVAFEPSGGRVGLHRTRAVLAAFALVLALAAVLGAGIWIGSGGPFPPPKTPQIIYVLPTEQPSSGAPASIDTAATHDSQPTDPGATPEANPDVTSGQTPAPPTPSPSPTATAPPTATTKPPTPKPPTPAPTPVLTPDLAVQVFQLGRFVPACNQQFTVQLSIRNQGQAATPHSVLAVVTDSPSASGGSKVTVVVPVLQKGATFSQDVQMLVNESCGQTHQLEVRVDESQTIGETSLMNNIASFTYYLPPEPMN